MSDASTPTPTSKPFAELVRAELALDRATELKGESWLETPPRPLFGLALSGGGIRSATFNLGLLQGLQELGMLRAFDYLTTVSGGGYTGAFWSQWRRLHPGQTFPEGRPGNGAEPHEVRHLRRFSRFLSPSLGVFSFDTGRMIIALINAVVPSLVGAIAFLAVLLLASIALAAFLLVLPAFAENRWLADVHLGVMEVGSALVAFITMLLFGLLHLLVMRAMWKRDGNYRIFTAPGVVLAVLLAAAWAVLNGFLPQLSRDAWQLFTHLGSCADACSTDTLLDHRLWLYALAPAAVFVIVPMATALVPGADHDTVGAARPLASIADQVNSWLIFAAAAWAVLTLLWWIAFNLFALFGTVTSAVATVSVSGIPLAVLVTWMGRHVGRVTRSTESRRQRAGRWLVAGASYLVVAAMVIAVMLLFVFVQHHQWWTGALLLTALGVLYVLLFYDPNRVGLHDFYRARVARGFIGAAHATGVDRDNDTDEQSDDDVGIGNLRGPALDMAGPLHLVVCAANNLTPKDHLSSLSRGAESAVLSPVGWSVGNQWVTWPERLPDADAEWKAEPPKLSAAVTASGAAFNTQMGTKSKSLGPAMAFVMASFGLRLGLWLRHPRDVTANASIVRRGRGLALVDELLGWSDAHHGKWVFLSDGGHFDNTGVYELVRRHCRYILVSDCGEDGDRCFDDLGSAVRRVREDFGVDIKINLDPLRPGASGLSRQPMVAGDIHYPDGDTGTLLVMKPSLTGHEPPDIVQYAARNAKFPHESTGDQFFDEAQWESYRRLGLHVIRTAFASSRGGTRHPTLKPHVPQGEAARSMEALRTRMARDFGVARREWLARPANYEQRIERLARAIGSLDALMPHVGAALARELSWELTWESPDRAETAHSANPAALTNHDDYLKALSALRQAIVVFESAFLSEQLSVNFNQPLYTGIMNDMARWMSAPLMRSWWPLLSSTCSVAFRQFAEAQFMLGNTPATLVVAQRSSEGALELATRHRRYLVRTCDDASCLRLLLTLQPPPGGDLLPHQVEVARLDATMTDGGTIRMWEARDLFVPPGLWGMGFGSALLRGAYAFREPAHPLVHAPRHVVFIRTLASGTPEEKKDSADLQQLYMDVGFDVGTDGDFARTDVQAVYATFHAKWIQHAPDLLPPADFAQYRTDERFAVLMR